MNQKQIIDMIPDNTDRKRVKGYSCDDYYNMPDSKSFTKKQRINWVIILLIDLVLFTLLLLMFFYYTTR